MTHTPLRLPETMKREDVGAYLAALREHFGLNAQDVAAQLHIRVRYLQAIERGEFDQLPGAVYARGYVTTYAEFLGLDAPQVADICFGSTAEMARNTSSAVVAAMPAGAKKPVMNMQHWRLRAGAGLVVTLLLLVLVQFRSHHYFPATVEIVPPVPEEMLHTSSTRVMPTPQNYDCLLGDDWSPCIVGSRLYRSLDTAMPEWDVVEKKDEPLSMPVLEEPQAQEPSPEREDATSRERNATSVPTHRLTKVRRQDSTQRHALPRKVSVSGAEFGGAQEDESAAAIDHNRMEH